MCIMTKTSNIIAKIKELFQEEKMAKDYRAATGEIIRCLGDSLAVGEKVIEIAAEKESPLADGNYLLDNGKTITVEAGTIKEINEYNAEKTKPEEVVMEKQEEMGEMKDKMEDYKKEPGGKEKLKERNPKAINDDYVKFLRYGQHFIEKKRKWYFGIY